MKVDGTKYDQKNREGMEAIEEAREKEAWKKFKYKKSGFRKRKENENIPEVNQRAKKPDPGARTPHGASGIYIVIVS